MSAPQYTVLLVDDNPLLIDLITAMLNESKAIKVICATDGVQGLEMCMQEHPDCMVIDVVMPGLDGFQLVRALRGDPITANIPLVILTAMAQDNARFTGLASGVDQYLVKPVTIDGLLQAIEFALSRSEADRALRLQNLAEGEPR
jgi:DNA-binding response OmpR family regulator